MGDRHGIDCRAARQSIPVSIAHSGADYLVPDKRGGSVPGYYGTSATIIRAHKSGIVQLLPSRDVFFVITLPKMVSRT